MSSEKSKTSNGKDSEYWNEGFQRGQEGKNSATPYIEFGVPPSTSETEARERGWEAGKTLSEQKKNSK